MESKQSIELIGRTREREQLLNLATAAQKFSGRILCISAESGYGKSIVLDTTIQELRAKQAVDAVRVECQQPIGALNIASIQPMQPWVQALELIVELHAGSAKKRLVVNIGLSVLGLIPIAGSIFDITKEIMRDLREYRADKRKDGTSTGDKVLNEFYEALFNISKQRPFVIMLDDAQWMDAQSVEFLEFLSKKSGAMPFSVVLSYQPSTVDVKNPSLSAWINEKRKGSDVSFLELDAFSNDAIAQAIHSVFPDQPQNTALLDWLQRRSAGVPITVCEYLNYFRNHSPFRQDGSLDADRLSSQSIPSSLQALLARNVESLNETDLNTLALCSAEGREFTVFIASQLMNVDTLTALKQLKSLQFRTGIIHSTGAHARYGVRTTVYEFTQALQHTYFHSTLEHEERIALHDRIAGILRSCYENTLDEQLQRQLAPYIAGHALEAGDEATARAMLVEAAHNAEESGSQQVLSSIVHSFMDMSAESDSRTERDEFRQLRQIAQAVGLDLGDDEKRSDGRDLEETSVDIIDCTAVRDEVLDLYFDAEYSEAARRASEFVDINGTSISPNDQMMLLLMAARCEIENQRLSVVEQYLDRAQNLEREHPDEYSRCLLENVSSIYEARAGNYQQSLKYLQRAAHTAAGAGDDCKLLTVTNIALSLRVQHKRQSRMFERIARQLCYTLHFHEFAEKVFVKN